MIVLPVGLYLLQVHSWCPWKPDEGVRSFGTGVTTVNNNAHWELNPGSLQEQPVLITAESSLHFPGFYVAQAGL